ncbi:hypothetical protein JTE90_003675 [Oedothorax gibbosus]|uniref:Ig-like domain-containing protein n=1 Tax=Oedothorax gibbosus TaxID=931172 RepID=A0AAV6VTZ2_9ARAC|nr:hypothetical protein JTE90_003675 [Oedothorax gibbosus]
MLMMDVPNPTNQGESVELVCSYELDEDKLYSVKWYKDDVEFYRYVPNDWPPGQFLPLQGVRVDLSKSGSQSVYLRHVDLNSAGLYRCEVSAEAPEFQTVTAEKEMKVLVLPTEGPRITGGLARYRVGDIVSVNCTSSSSKPAATLNWYINDRLVSEKIDSSYQTQESRVQEQSGLESSSLSLRFVASEHHFHSGNMKLKCTATISRVYTMSNEELVFRQQNSGLHITENMSHVRNSAGQKPVTCLLLFVFLHIIFTFPLNFVSNFLRTPNIQILSV